jgi:hypothetical protein
MNWNWVLEFFSELESESELELAFLGEKKRKEKKRKLWKKRLELRANHQFWSGLPWTKLELGLIPKTGDQNQNPT